MSAPDLQVAAYLWANGFTVNEMAVRLGLRRGQLLGVIHRNRDAFPFRSASASSAAVVPTCVCPTCGTTLRGRNALR